MNTQDEIKRRRTFAIISHPDAGKTTLTEKLLLYGGAILSAGTVKGRKNSKHAVSDWMEIERQRGISVTSSVMQFEYDNYCINILDTPGHQDFSEDTYRTLMAADSAVMVIDASKGVEAQTKKLFKVCLLRHIPVFTFINKMDRAAMNPFALLEHIEKELGISTYAMNWPIGSGKDFKGVYERNHKQILCFAGGQHGQREVEKVAGDLQDEKFRSLLGDDFYEQLMEDVELLDIASTVFEADKVQNGRLTPVFFGSALTNFGVEPFLSHFLAMTTSPLSRYAGDVEIEPTDDHFSAFVFKIQANMNKAHRDRIAFLRICSGKFEKGMEVTHVQANRKIKLAQPQQFLAQERTIVEEAYPGDIIGIFDPGIFGIGDSLSDEKLKIQFEDFPVFPPEIFARVQPKDSLKRKQFEKGIVQLAQEGAIQVFRQKDLGIESFIVGVVGSLQLEVLEYRLLNEYSAQLLMNQLGYSVARWVYAENEKDIENLKGLDNGMLVYDKKDRPVILVNNEWALNWILDRNPNLQFLTVPSDVAKI